MTKTALANKELATKKSIERSKLLHDTDQQALNRQQKERESVRSAKASLYGAGINALGRIGGSLIKANDPSFYKGYINNLQDFVNVPTYDRLGNGKFIKSSDYIFHADDGEDIYTFDVPGIMAFAWMPMVGPQVHTTNYYQDPINQVLARVKEKVLALSSRSSVNWEPGDLGYNLFCSCDIMTMILDLGRVIKAYQTYNSKNAYLAQSLVTALGWNYSDIVANFADYRKVYDILARKFNSSIVLPVDIGLIKRRAYLATNVFADVADPKYPRQLYVFKQKAFLELSNDAVQARMLPSSVSKTNISTFKAKMDECISRIVDNPDFNEMYQDLRHAFGSHLVQIDESVTDSVLEFNVYDLNREQIHNLETAPYLCKWGTFMDAEISGGAYTGFGLHQDSSGYLYQGSSDPTHGYKYRRLMGTAEMTDLDKGSVMQLCNTGIFNMHKEDVTGDDIIDITRLRSTFTENLVISDDFAITYMSCGTEVIIDAKVYTFAANLPNAPYLANEWFSTKIISSIDSTDTWGAYCSVSEAACHTGYRSAFDWAPITQWLFGITDKDITSNDSLITYMDTCTTFHIERGMLARIHEACVLGELYYPDAAFTSTFK